MAYGWCATALVSTVSLCKCSGGFFGVKFTFTPFSSPESFVV